MDDDVESGTTGLVISAFEEELQRYNVNTLYSAPLRFIRQERSVAPSISNIKARGLAHCLYSLKLSLYKVYWLYFNDNMALSDGRTCKNYFFRNIDKS